MKRTKLRVINGALSIFRPGDEVIVKVSMNAHFIVDSSEIRDGELWIKAHADSDYVWEIPAHAVVCRDSEIFEEAQAEAV